MSTGLYTVQSKQWIEKERYDDDTDNDNKNHVFLFFFLFFSCYCFETKIERYNFGNARIHLFDTNEQLKNFKTYFVSVELFVNQIF